MTSAWSPSIAAFFASAIALAQPAWGDAPLGAASLRLEAALDDANDSAPEEHFRARVPVLGWEAAGKSYLRILLHTDSLDATTRRVGRLLSGDAYLVTSLLVICGASERCELEIELDDSRDSAPEDEVAVGPVRLTRSGEALRLDLDDNQKGRYLLGALFDDSSVCARRVEALPSAGTGVPDVGEDCYRANWLILSR